MMFAAPVASSPRTSLDFFQSKSALSNKEMRQSQAAEHQLPSTAVARAFIAGQESTKVQPKSINNVHIHARHSCTMASTGAFRASSKHDSPPLPPRRYEKAAEERMVAGWKEMCIPPMSEAQREVNARASTDWKEYEIQKAVFRSPTPVHDAEDLKTAGRYSTLHQSGQSHGLRTQQSLCEPTYHWITSNTALNRSVHSATFDTDQMPRNSGKGFLCTSLHATRAAHRCNTDETDTQAYGRRTRPHQPESSCVGNASQEGFASSESLPSKCGLSDHSLSGSRNDERIERGPSALRRSPVCRTKPLRSTSFHSPARCLQGRSLHSVSGHHTSSRVDPPERLSGSARRDLHWTVGREDPRNSWSNDSLSRPSCPTRELSSMSDSSASTIESFSSFA